MEPDADWDGLAITVVFRRVHALGSEARSVVVSNQDAAYYVPHEVLHDGWLYIGAAGVASSGAVKLTTAKLDRPIRVYDSEDAAADPSGSITPEIADQILALIGTVSNLDTNDKTSLVAAINEVHGNTKGVVKTVNQIAPNVRGDVHIMAESINAQVPSLDYQGSVEGALEALATMPAALPVARASSADGIAYTATGDDLPTVQTGSHDTQTDPVGKGRQIVFIPWVKNQNDAPTLQLNGGEIIPLRLRAPQTQNNDDQSPEATLPVPVGALMRGVPYTLTFCGKYWLVDSQIAQFSCAGNEYQAAVMRAMADVASGMTDGDTIGMPIVNSMDGIAGHVSSAFIARSAAEYAFPPEDGSVRLPTQQRVEEMIRTDVTAKYAAWTPDDGAEKTVANYAKTLQDGKYYIFEDGYASCFVDVFTSYGDVQWRVIREYTDEFLFIKVYCGNSLLLDTDAETVDVMINGKRMLTNYNIPLPTTADVGKVLVAYSENRAAWTAVTNAEEVAV